MHLADDTGTSVPVVARVRIARAGKTLVERQRVRISLDPLAPRGEGNGHVLQLCPLERTGYGLRKKVAPQRAGLAVEHDERVHNELAGNAEVQDLAVYLSGVPDSSKAERSPRDRNRLPSHHVVHDFMPAE